MGLSCHKTVPLNTGTYPTTEALLVKSEASDLPDFFRPKIALRRSVRHVSSSGSRGAKSEEVSARVRPGPHHPLPGPQCEPPLFSAY